MNENTKEAVLTDDKKYMDSVHRLGRIFTAVISVIVVGIPLTVCLVYNCMPRAIDIIAPMLTIMAAFLPVQVSEVFSFAPILGSSSYITFVTGNVQNLKLPSAISAQNVAGVTPGTPEADAVATVAVSISSIETIVIMCLCVLLFVPLQPVLTSEAFSTMSAYILPALYGSLAVTVFANSRKKGAKIIKNKWLLPVVPMLCTVLCILFIPTFKKIQSYYLIVLILITIGWAYLLYRKGKVDQIVRE